MKKASDVFKSIRFAKGEPRGKEHSSTDNEEHYTVGEKEFGQQLKHVKKMAMQEEKKDEYDEGEYDQEGDMAKSDLRSIIANAKRVHDMLEDSDNLPEWVQSKITKAEDYMSTVANYMEAEMNESVEQIDEISSDVLRKAKHKAYALSSQADQEGKTKEADKRFSQGVRFQNREYDVSKKEGQKFSKYMAQKEEVEHLEEKNVPTSPEKWAQAKAQAKAKFDVYPSAYANGWAAKKYKEMGGGWKSVSEEVEQIEEMKMSPHKQAVVAAGGGTPADQGIYAAQKEKPPFEGGTKTKDKVIPGKYGKGYSTARHLARMAMQKQAEKVKKPIKEESKKAKIVKDVMKKKTSEDAFQKDPELSNTLSKNV